jgi:hypothetical protein
MADSCQDDLLARAILFIAWIAEIISGVNCFKISSGIASVSGNGSSVIMGGMVSTSFVALL